jgi:hypothetical protein
VGNSKLVEVCHNTGYIDATCLTWGRRFFLKQQVTGVESGRLGLNASDVKQ